MAKQTLRNENEGLLYVGCHGTPTYHRSTVSKIENRQKDSKVLKDALPAEDTVPAGGINEEDLAKELKELKIQVDQEKNDAKKKELMVKSFITKNTHRHDKCDRTKTNGFNM